MAIGPRCRSPPCGGHGALVAARRCRRICRPWRRPSPELKSAGVSGTDSTLRFGEPHRAMKAHSGAARLAPYPGGLDPQFLVHKTAPSARMMRSRRAPPAAGAFHVRNTAARCEHRRAGNGYYMARRTLEGTVSAASPARRSSRAPGRTSDIAHQPSLAFVPYLVTGGSVLRDEVAYWRTSASSAPSRPTTTERTQGLPSATRSAASDGGCATSGMRRPTCRRQPMKAYTGVECGTTSRLSNQYASTYQSAVQNAVSRPPAGRRRRLSTARTCGSRSGSSRTCVGGRPGCEWTTRDR